MVDIRLSLHLHIGTIFFLVGSGTSCLNGTGTGTGSGMHFGFGSGFRSGSEINWNKVLTDTV
jgi:hypothetical protein